MRWTEKPKPKRDEKRTIKRFLFLPLCIGNEYRWLKTTSIEQCYLVPSNRISVGEWYNIAWIDKS